MQVRQYACSHSVLTILVDVLNSIYTNTETVKGLSGISWCL